MPGLANPCPVILKSVGKETRLINAPSLRMFCSTMSAPSRQAARATAWLGVAPQPRGPLLGPVWPLFFRGLRTPWPDGRLPLSEVETPTSPPFRVASAHVTARTWPAIAVGRHVRDSHGLPNFAPIKFASPLAGRDLSIRWPAPRTGIANEGCHSQIFFSLATRRAP